MRDIIPISYEHNHYTNVKNVKILYLSYKGKHLDLLEAFQIKKHSLKNSLINQQLNLADSPLLSTTYPQKYLPTSCINNKNFPGLYLPPSTCPS